MPEKVTLVPDSPVSPEPHAPLSSEPLSLREIPSFFVYDKRPKLPRSELSDSLKAVRRVFDLIARDASAIDRDLMQHHEDDIALKLQNLKDTKRPKVRSRQDRSPLQHAPEAPLPESELPAMETLKINYLRLGLAERLKGKGSPQLRAIILELVAAIQRERYSQGLALYDENGILTLVYEIVYGDFLWRDQLRKDGKTSYFRSHLIEAVRQHIIQGFTGLPSLMAALKHDDYEDLAIHRDGCWEMKTVDQGVVKNNQLDPKVDWLFCDSLYREHFSIPDQASSLKYNPFNEIPWITKSVHETVRAVTAPAAQQKVRTKEEKQARDEEKATAYLNNLLKNGHATTLKTLEQIHNALTIGGLSTDRQETKLRLMMRLYGLMTRVMQLDHAERQLLGAGVDFFRPNLRPWFMAMQQQRLSDRFGQDPDYTRLLDVLFKTRRHHPGESLAPILSNLIEVNTSVHSDIEARSQKIRRRIEAIFKPKIKGVHGIEIRPTPLEHYLDVNRLMNNRDYYPEIPPDDPLFEILILVDNDQSIHEISCDVMKHINIFQRVILHAEAPPTAEAPKGIPIEFIGTLMGGMVRIRVNTTQNEARAKRGVRANSKDSIPKWLKDRIRHTLKETRQSGTPLLDVAEEILLRPMVWVETDGKRERIYLPEGATLLDFAAALPGDTGMQALSRGGRYFKRDGQGRHSRLIEISRFETISLGDVFHIEIGDSVQLDVAHLAFATDERTRKIAREFWNRAVSDEIEPSEGLTPEDHQKRLNALRQRARIDRGTAYCQRLGSILGLDDNPRLLPFLVMQSIDRYPKEIIDDWERAVESEAPPTGLPSVRNRARNRYKSELRKVLSLIGNAQFDPLKALARHLDRKRGCQLKFVVPDQINVLGTISSAIGQRGINIDQQPGITFNRQSHPHTATLNFSLQIPDAISDYDFLKFILRLSDDYFVYLDGDIFDFGSEDCEIWTELGRLNRLFDTQSSLEE